MRVFVNGEEEMMLLEEDKEDLAEKPWKYVLKGSQRHLSIGFDLTTDQITMKHLGVDAEKLPQVEKILEICRNKIVDTTIGDQRQVQFHTIFDN